MPETATTPSAPILSRPPAAYHQTFEIAATDTLGFLPQLNALLTVENANGYTFQASPYAYENAKSYVQIARAILGLSFISPEFIPDGEGGIDIEWNNDNRNVTLSCRGTDTQNDYIYWEEDGAYDARDASLALLIHRLNWLNYA